MGQDVDAAREALGTVPPARPARAVKTPDAGAGGSGPHAPGHPEAEAPGDAAPESGGYDTRPPVPQPDNRKGGYGAG
ncbi:hypothetical protein [Methylobacterium brachiatum]|jgi:hypothetical protein|uniref:Uncharacterized protein n=1 Tax=Methylobacterium brachiatum TaxID=269660 RepID=A0AAJ1WY44_9HYPH|nr:hypothetical protein [Methylobacterium brachiatum]AYO84646.1 hypothetical protein EBB05_21950 [Methylobacterium brachiatum]MCB4806138.1 hypothetical protein [Methylobacterium brachiatum]MDH2312970.1 hypothetical protein [Methylobacterium brachiatum]MDQ0544905.1 hypothetical protein [Methylobacterium brachiatum]SFJ40766.1 hypothetical protein SAMN02799642_04338 [Methylobacterium brachiatum]